MIRLHIQTVIDWIADLIWRVIGPAIDRWIFREE